MKRLHIHVGVNDLDQSIRFYSTLFAAEPTVVKEDYAKWMLEDPRVNFAISAGQHPAKGIQHLGVQAESIDELGEVYGRLKAADRRYSKRAERPAAMPIARRVGSPIPTESSGKPSSPTAKPRPMARVPCSVPWPIASARTNAAFREQPHEQDL